MQSKSDNRIMLKKTKKERLFYLKLNSRFKSLRKRLKKPLGMLIPLEHPSSTEYIKDLVEILRPNQIITVGDRVTEYMISSGLKPDLAIIDMQVERKSINSKIKGLFKKEIELKNPAGRISNDAIKEIKNALKSGNSLLLVKGEEDLLALPAINFSKIGSLVFYGMPKLGVVAVYCTKNKKKAINKILTRGS